MVRVDHTTKLVASPGRVSRPLQLLEPVPPTARGPPVANQILADQQLTNSTQIESFQRETQSSNTCGGVTPANFGLGISELDERRLISAACPRALRDADDRSFWHCAYMMQQH